MLNQRYLTGFEYLPDVTVNQQYLTGFEYLPMLNQQHLTGFEFLPPKLHCKVPVTIQYKCLVPILELLFPKQNYNVLSPRSYTHISVRDLYISRIDLPILLQGNMWTDPGNIYIAHRYMNVRIGTEAALFPEKE
jgi:hypothetical protein